MNESILTWNFANWVTVVLMVATLYFLAALATRLTGAKFGTTKKGQ